MKELSIKVSIAGRVYPLTVQHDEEENIRKAVKAIDEMVKEYEQNYAVKDKQDLLAMCALQYATKSLSFENKTVNDENGVEEKLEKLNALITQHL